MIASIKIYTIGGEKFIIFENELYARRQDDADEDSSPEKEEETEESEPAEETLPAEPVRKRGRPAKGYVKPDKPVGAAAHRAPRKCSKCNRPGHTYRTCTGGVSVAVDVEPSAPAVSKPEAEPSENRSLRERVAELWRDGLDPEEMSEYLPSESLVEIRAIYEHLERNGR